MEDGGWRIEAGGWRIESPKVYVRDSGLVHALLGIPDHFGLSGHPVVGASWEGFVIENVIAAAPDLAIASFYRTSAGAEIDLVLEIPGHGLWVFDIKRGMSARPEKGFHLACGDLRPARCFFVSSGHDRYPITGGVEAIGLTDIMTTLAALE